MAVDVTQGIPFIFSYYSQKLNIAVTVESCLLSLDFPV
jgi:hypothetical protein